MTGIRSSFDALKAFPPALIHASEIYQWPLEKPGRNQAGRPGIELDPVRFGADAFCGLDQFSHVEIVFLMHMVDENAVVTGKRRPRDRVDWPLVGIFAQRGSLRPNRIGVSRCKIENINGTVVTVRALDAVVGTPVLDIKPYMIEFAPAEELRQSDWSRQLMADYYRRK